jgi:ParB-like chromosome segregation protein Spo0J
MRKTGSTSSWPSAKGSRETERLHWVPLGLLRPHPSNPNLMNEEQLCKLAENISREGDYPPLLVRPHPEEEGAFQLLGGHQTCKVLKRLGHEQALCYIWPCDNETALVLLATLNRLQGTDEPLKRAQLLRDLATLAPVEELAALLPEDAATIHQSLEFLDSDLEALLAAFGQEPTSQDSLRAITFVVTSEDEAVIEDAVAAVARQLDGKNRRGRALAEIARTHLANSEGPRK